VVVVFGAAWQEWYRQERQRRTERDFGIQGGCLVRADGPLPAVRQVTDPVVLGVHPAAAAPDGAGRAGVPAYVPRDADGQVRESLAAGGLVLLVGDSAAGKSRLAFEAVGTLPRHVLICPASRDAPGVAVDQAAAERRRVLWLDDLERFPGAGGLTPEQLGRLLAGSGHHRVVVATIRAAGQARVTAGPLGGDARAAREIRLVLGQARSIRVDRMFTPAELERWRPGPRGALWHRRVPGGRPGTAARMGRRQGLLPGPACAGRGPGSRSGRHPPRRVPVPAAPGTARQGPRALPR
jgi:hypothetical protein